MGVRRCSIRAFGFVIHRDERPNVALLRTLLQNKRDQKGLR